MDEFSEVTSETTFDRWKLFFSLKEKLDFLKTLSTPDFDSWNLIAVSGPTEHCPIFHFPSVRPPFVLRHRRDISTFLDILTVYTMKTIYFLNAYHLGW